MACTIDFRCLDEGFGGKTYKRKRSEQAEALNRSIQPQIDDNDGGATSMVHGRRQQPSSVEETSRPPWSMNILRSGTKLQKITNPKTLKKIAKSKQRKLLKVVPDDLVNNKKRTTKKN